MSVITQRVDEILKAAVGRDLSSRERHNFLPSIRENRTISAKQEIWLSAIEARLGLIEGEEEDIDEERNEDDTSLHF